MFPSNHRVVSSGKKHVLSHPKQKEVALIQNTTHQIYISRSSAVTERKKKIIELIHLKKNGLLGRVPASFQCVCACKNVASSNPTCKQGGHFVEPMQASHKPSFSWQGGNSQLNSTQLNSTQLNSTQSRPSQQNCYGPQGTWEKNSLFNHHGSEQKCTKTCSWDNHCSP